MPAQLTQNLTREIADKININDIIAGVPGVSFLITLAQAIGVLVLIYIIFLIVRAASGIKTASRLKRIAEVVESIDKKLDILTNKKKK